MAHVVLKCVRFAPTEDELFEEFLFPELAHNDEESQASLIHDFDLYESNPISAEKGHRIYFPTNNHWYFVTRVSVTPNSI